MGQGSERGCGRSAISSDNGHSLCPEFTMQRVAGRVFCARCKVEHAATNPNLDQEDGVGKPVGLARYSDGVIPVQRLKAR